MENRRVSFASDNYAPALPEILLALAQIPDEHCPAYGADRVTLDAAELVSKFCGGALKVLFTFNGTGANIVSLGLVSSPGSTVLCSEFSHIAVDEGGAPEALLGLKLKLIPSADAKIRLEDLENARTLERQGDRHASQIRFISLSMSSEYGTVYSIDEVRSICAWAKKQGIYVHVDGARILNATAFLEKKDLGFLKEAGVDVLSLGGTKAGLLFGECVVIWNAALAQNADFVQKRLLQLSSKTRYISQQFLSLLRDNLGLSRAKHANDLALRLEKGLKLIKGIRVTQAVQANAVFAEIPRVDYTKLQTQFPFYIWNQARNEARFMCSWNLHSHDIDLFLKSLQETINQESDH